MDDDKDDDYIPEDHCYLEGECTCQGHDGPHGWTGCEVDSCNCERHWEY